jgi:molybdopterin-synthase adenylyltransferase
MDATIRFAGGQWTTLQEGLWSRTDVETGAILFAEAVRSSGSASLAVRKVVIVPMEAYRARRSDFMEIDPVWMNKQCFDARQQGFSVLTAHTHLTDGRAWFSWADDAGDERLMPALLAQMPDRLHGALNVTRTDALARVYLDGTFQVAQISVASGRLLLLPQRESPDSAKAAHSRQQLALGRQGQARLTTLRVGVVGAGGTGSVVCALLGRLGIHRLLIFDGDCFDASNLSRILESVSDDVAAKTPKTTIVRRALHASAPDVAVTTVHRALAHHDDLALLATCDVVFSCVDRLAPRALLNRLAYAAHIPVIDMGSAFRVGGNGDVISQGGKVVLIGPGRPCLWCWGDLDAERIRVESLDPGDREREAEHGYITGVDEPQPSVVTFNATLAAAAVTEFLRMVTGFAGSDAPPDRINFDFARATATRVRGRSQPDCSFCGAIGGGAPLAPTSDRQGR